jgi:photosystem II stability/assembly factor-like uncharacterized protein
MLKLRRDQYQLRRFRHMKKALVIIIIPSAVIGIVAILFSLSSKQQTNPPENKLSPAAEITHGHGLGLDPTDSTKLYIATHHGLYVLKDEKNLFAVGQDGNDYMGFSPDLNKTGRFFASGHPISGGNIGFQMSEDGGFTWKTISDGIDGPVDFHAMTVSPASSNLVYGWYRGAVQRSTDAGKTWQKFPNKFIIVNFAADPNDENIIYAASPQGLFVSNNKGQDWTSLLDPLQGGFISTVGIDPHNSKDLLAFSDKMGLINSTDSGTTWKKIDANFSGETPLYIVRSKQTLNLGYFITEKNSIYKTTDNGFTWKKIRLGNADNG